MSEYLRHPNGRGRLFDDAEANRGTYISRDSSAHGSVKLRDCRFERAVRASGSCQIYGGVFTSSQIRGRTIIAGRPTIHNSLIDCSEISGLVYLDACILLGTTEIADNVVARDAIFRDAIVYGDAQVWPRTIANQEQDFTGRIHEGTWTRPPKHIKLPWCHLTECVDGKLLLDCRCRKIDYWLRHGPKLAKRWDWSDDQISVTLDTIRREFATTIPLPEIRHETIMRV